MPRANPLQAAFNAGEIGPRLAARVDFAKYRNAGARVENLIPLPQGGLTRRPGTRYVAPAADHAKRSRLIPFEFSTEQAYVIEACDGCFRFFRNKAQVVVEPTDAAVTNGDFATGISGWTDLSTGTANISGGPSGAATVDTRQFPTAGGLTWGQSDNPVRHCIGFQFVAPADASFVDAQISNGVHGSGTIPFSVVAGIYEDAGGSVGVQVGGDSNPSSVPNNPPFTFPVPPVMSGGQTYWFVLTSTSIGRINQLACWGRPGFAGGYGTTPSAISVGSGGYSSNLDLKIEIRLQTISSDGTMNLNGAASSIAWAEQAVSTTSPNQMHVVAFDILDAPGNSISLRVGNASGNDLVLSDVELATGRHMVAFTPFASPFYLQFRNLEPKTVRIDDVSIVASGAEAPLPLGLWSPYGSQDLPTLKWTQSADVMYLAHGKYPPYKLERRGDATWSIVQVDFLDGPYMEENTDATRVLNPVSTSGTDVAVIASGFELTPDLVGRVLRLSHDGNEPGWGIVTRFIASNQVRVDIRRDFSSATATSRWRFGTWSNVRGYPTSVTFFEQRLAWANSKARPQSFWMSQSADIENMRPDSFEGSSVEVQDDDALEFTIAADQVNAIRWMSPGRQLILGTSGGEWSVTSDGPVLTPLDLAVRRESTNGSANILPVRISSIVLFVQRAKRKLREFVFSLETDGFRTPDLTILADHISESGIREVAYQQEPDSQVHCLREDGVLATLTYRREQDVVGWSRHILGGRLQGGNPVIESITTIPGNAAAGSENRDEAWVAVKRTIDGSTYRSIEVFEAPFEGPNPEGFDVAGEFDAAVLAAQSKAFYVDAGLSYEGPPTESLFGLEHLEGEAVAVLADGAHHPDRIVAGGTINLETPASIVHVGLAYRHTFKSLKIDVGAAAGTAVGKLKRIHGIVLVLLHSLGLRIGPSIDRLEAVPLREVKDAMDTAVPLFTGETYVSFDGDYQRDARVVISGDAPLPFTVLAAAPELKTNGQI